MILGFYVHVLQCQQAAAIIDNSKTLNFKGSRCCKHYTSCIFNKWKDMHWFNFVETSKKNLKVFIQIVFISWNLHKPHTQYVGISMMHIYDNKNFWLAGFFKNQHINPIIVMLSVEMKIMLFLKFAQISEPFC